MTDRERHLAGVPWMFDIIICGCSGDFRTVTVRARRHVDKNKRVSKLKTIGSCRQKAGEPTSSLSREEHNMNLTWATAGTAPLHSQ
jgi:hypothetical protein